MHDALSLALHYIMLSYHAVSVVFLTGRLVFCYCDRVVVKFKGRRTNGCRYDSRIMTSASKLSTTRKRKPGCVMYVYARAYFVMYC
jgi:hypothetical protein